LKPSSTYYKSVINDAVAAGLNVIRLWVDIAGLPMTSPCRVDPDSDPNDQPFEYDGTNPQSDGLGSWHLDVRNVDYFNRLKEVIQYATSPPNNMFVEVTLFAPQEGQLQLGPWSHAHAFRSDSSTALTGFSDTAQFVNKDSAQYLAMKPYVFNVVHWTVDALSSFPTVYYEVANEPEYVQPSAAPACPGWAAKSTTDPATVAAWQNEIAVELKSYIASKGVTQQVAVEPLTTTAAAPFRSASLPPPDDAFTGVGQDSANASIINSHYANLSPKPGTGGNLGHGLGAIHLAREWYSQQKILGFNETKIVADGCGGKPNFIQSVDEGRAEAWEFMVDQGGIYNQFGYRCGAVSCPAAPAAPSNARYCETRRQMGVLRSFLASTAVRIGTNMKTSLTNCSATIHSPCWINIESYPILPIPPNTVFKFWAAVEPTAAAGTKRWLLYIHHSKDRGLAFDGYRAEIITQPGAQYQEGGPAHPLSVCLGTTPGDYQVRWINPATAWKNGAVNANPVQAIHWAGSASCTPGGQNAVTLAASPKYAYDIALLISP